MADIVYVTEYLFLKYAFPSTLFYVIFLLEEMQNYMMASRGSTRPSFRAAPRFG